MEDWTIEGINFKDLPAEKYWTFPTNYKGNKQEETKNLIFSNNYIGARKMDGAYFRFIKDNNGNMRLQSRSLNVDGEYLDKIEWVPQLESFFKVIPNGTCLLGEIYFPKNEGSRHVTTIMGCLKEKAIKRQEKEKLHYYIFDIWAWNGISFLHKTAEERFNFLCSTAIEKTYSSNEYVEFAKYYYGPQLWEELSKIREVDGEGVVITREDSIPEPGKRTARKTLKIKKELDNPIDCFLTGRYKIATRDYKGKNIEGWEYWLNLHDLTKSIGEKYREYALGAPIIPITKAYYFGWASAIEIAVLDENQKEYSVGWISGITEEVREGIVTNPEMWKHKVVKINAMDIEKDTYALRHGKIIEWRAPGDKNWTECSISQLMQA